MPAVEKLCCICGKDVAAAKRVKDQRGRYFCEACAKKAPRQAKPAAAAVAAVQGRPGSAPPPLPAAGSPESNELDLAPVRESVQENVPKSACSRCKKLFPERQVRRVDGEFLCNACYSQQNAARPGSAKPAARARPDKTAEPEEAGSQETFATSLGGSAVISAAMLVVAFFVFFGLYRTFADGGVSGTASCVIAGGVRTVLLLFSTGGLILSMIVAARILGGITFGALGPLVYKSIGFFLVVGVMDHLMDHFETMAMLGFGFRFVLILIAFIALFKIDMFEAFLLTVVNTGISWVLAIVLVMTLMSLGAASQHDSGDLDTGDDQGAPLVQPADPGPGGGGAAPGNAAPANPDAAPGLQ